MEFLTRRVNDYFTVTFEYYSDKIELGLLDKKEAKILLEDLKFLVEDLEKLNHHTNIRPLLAIDNIKKSDKVLFLI